jgi:hypothetical protein
MATSTIGTNANNSLTAIVMVPAGLSGYQLLNGGYFPNIADFATIDAGMLDDINPTHPIYGPTNGLTPQGLLYVPNRGVLRVRPGDYVAIDTTTGWPILISARAAASGPWTHSP